VALTETPRSTTPPAPTSPHEEKAIAFFGTWAIFGLYLDGWAHIHDKPETFFSPWHGVLYSGVGAAVAYFGFRDIILRKASAISDALLTVGFTIFAIGAGGDFVWHELFGIEADLEALLSPTHLMLLTGGVLMLSYAARASIARGEARKVRFGTVLPVIVSLTLTAMLVMFFTQYFAAFEWQGLWINADREQQELWEVAGIGTVFVTNAIILATSLVAVRHWDTPFGTFTLMYTTMAVGISGMVEFEPWAQIPAMFAVGLITDLLARRLRPSPDRRRHAFAFAMAVPFVMWSAWTLALHVMDGVRWPVDLWAGMVYLAVLEGVGLAVLTFPRRSVPVEVVASGDVRDEPFRSQDQL
jgi:hypothetical protein